MTPDTPDTPDTPGEGGTTPSQPAAPDPNEKVYVTIINHNDSGIGMVHSAEKIRGMLLGSNPRAKEANISWTNYNKERPTAEELKNRIADQIAKVPNDGLYIFYYGGHGGNGKVNGVKCQYLSLPNSKGKICDHEIW